MHSLLHQKTRYFLKLISRIEGSQMQQPKKKGITYIAPTHSLNTGYFKNSLNTVNIITNQATKRDASINKA